MKEDIITLLFMKNITFYHHERVEIVASKRERKRGGTEREREKERGDRQTDRDRDEGLRLL